jgi:hypothetical protein
MNSYFVVPLPVRRIDSDHNDQDLPRSQGHVPQAGMRVAFTVHSLRVG